MGSNCCKKSNNDMSNIYSTKALMNAKNFNGMDFYFSTQNLSRLQGECLIIFSDKRVKIKKSNLAQKVSDIQSRKLKQYVNAHLQNNTQTSTTNEQKKMHDSIRTLHQSASQNSPSNHFMVIDIDVSTIKFSKFVVIYIEPWEGNSSIKQIISSKILKAFNHVETLGITQIAIVQFDQQFGVPINIGASILARSIFNASSKFKIATICCRTISDQLTYISFFENWKQEITNSLRSGDSAAESNYF